MDQFQFSFERGKISQTTFCRKQNFIKEEKLKKTKERTGRPRQPKGIHMQKVTRLALRVSYPFAQKIVNRLNSKKRNCIPSAKI